MKTLMPSRQLRGLVIAACGALALSQAPAMAQSFSANFSTNPSLSTNQTQAWGAIFQTASNDYEHDFPDVYQNGSLVIITSFNLDPDISERLRIMYYGNTLIELRFQAFDGNTILDEDYVYLERSDVDYFTIYCGRGDDQAVNNTGVASTMYGNEGDDVLVGGSEDDQLSGDEGLDTLSGYEGSDVLNGGFDGLPDILIAGAGPDLIVIHKPVYGTAESETTYGFDPNEDSVTFSYHW